MRTLIASLAAAIALAQGWAPQAAAQTDKPLGERLYDVVASGLPSVTPGRRINHIKGAMYEGVFTPSPEAASLSSAPQFQGGTTKLVIRFSNVGGIPDVPDNSLSTSVRGMAISFRLPDGASTDLVCINMPVFIVKTPEDFITLNKAFQSVAAADPHPNVVEQWMGSHPETKAFLSTPRPMPVSYATQDYFAIQAYKLVDAGGADKFVRFHIVPEAGKQFLSKEDAAKTEPNVLIDEMRSRVAKSPATYRMEAQIAEPGDTTNDSTVAWPEGRKVVTLGTIAVTTATADSAGAEKTTVFLPNKTVKGLGLSDDPFLDARTATYEVAFDKRK